MGRGNPPLSVMSKCYNCRCDSDDFLCPLCKQAVEDGSIHLTFPGVTGVSDGPGSGNGEMVFDRIDTYNETRRTLARMEENGAFKDPVKMAKAKKILEHAKRHEGKKLDKQKQHNSGGLI